MKSVPRIPQFLAPILWDVKDHTTLDIKKYRSFIIARVAEKGRWEDVQWLKKTYGVAAIRRTVAGSRNVSKKVKNFWKII